MAQRAQLCGALEEADEERGENRQDRQALTRENLGFICGVGA
jgi:hypothetical protein